MPPDASQPVWFNAVLAAVVEQRDLHTAEMRDLIQGLLAGNLAEAESAALLVALRMKGESAQELATAAQVIREQMVPLATLRGPLLDTCGTGGDGSSTFNISTTTAIVVAAAGVPVVKHGNRAISSRSGASDVLGILGVPFDGGAAAAAARLERHGIAFCHAPDYHPALKGIAALRRRLAIRTIFNLLGPLANPAGATFQLLGVGRPAWLDPMAGALARLGTSRAYLVSSRDGLDEVSLSAPTLVREVHEDKVTSHEWTAADFGLESCRLDELRADGPEQSAATIRSVLKGQPGAALNVVLANVSAALMVAGKVTSLKAGVAQARAIIHEGRALDLLREITSSARIKR